MIAFGDSAALRFGRPATTAVQAPSFDMARHAVDVLMAQLERKPIEVVRRWATKLVDRESVGPVAG